MKSGEQDCSVACMVPVCAPEGLVIFDHLFVPDAGADRYGARDRPME